MFGIRTSSLSSVTIYLTIHVYPYITKYVVIVSFWCLTYQTSFSWLWLSRQFLRRHPWGQTLAYQFTALSLYDAGKEPSHNCSDLTEMVYSKASTTFNLKLVSEGQKVLSVSQYIWKEGCVIYPVWLEGSTFSRGIATAFAAICYM